MQIRGHHKWPRENPFSDGAHFRLELALLVLEEFKQMVVVGKALLLHEVEEGVQVGEVPVQVNAMGIATAGQPSPLVGLLQNRSKLIPFQKHTDSSVGQLKTVRIHGGHDVHIGGIQQLNNWALSGTVLVAQIVGQSEEHLSANCLVAVHVANVFHFRLQRLMASWVGGEFDDSQLAALNAATNAVQASDAESDGWRALCC